MSIQWQYRSKGICFLVKNEQQNILATSAFFRNERWARIGFINACELGSAPIVVSAGKQEKAGENAYTDYIRISQKSSEQYFFQYIFCSGKILLRSECFSSLENVNEAIGQVHSELAAYRTALRKSKQPIPETLKKK